MLNMKVPPAIFTCGTLDPLLDDSVLMTTKWTMSGAEAVLKLYPGKRIYSHPIRRGVQLMILCIGAPHGFVFFPVGGTPETQKALDDIKMFLDSHM
jgi:acetyl esterase/lipase